MIGWERKSGSKALILSGKIQSVVSTTPRTPSANLLPNPPPTPLQTATPAAMTVEAAMMMMVGHGWVGRGKGRGRVGGTSMVSGAKAAGMIMVVKERGG